MLRLLMLVAVMLSPALSAQLVTSRPGTEQDTPASICCASCVPSMVPGIAAETCGCGCQAEAPIIPTVPSQPRTPSQNESGRFFAGLSEPPLRYVLTHDDLTPRRPRAVMLHAYVAQSGPDSIPFLCRWTT